MRLKRVVARLCGVEKSVIEGVEFDDGEQALVVGVRAKSKERGRCGICRKRCPGYDAGEGFRRWRTLDLGTVRCFVEAVAPRVSCPRHGVVTQAIPWARHDTRFTRTFEDSVAWLACQASRTAVSDYLRISWRTVTAICARVAADQASKGDRLSGLRRIGIDEIAHRKGHRYATLIVDHDTGLLVWMAPGNDKATLGAFFDLLGERRCAEIKLVSADGAEWIEDVVKGRCPNARQCMDPFHIVAWATKALDEVRRQTWNQARQAGQTALARELKGARFALWKNPEDLTQRQQAKLSSIQKTNARLYRAYLLKEQLRQVFQLPYTRAVLLLDRWLAWASRSKIPAFVKVARSIRARRAAIHNTLAHELSNARVESINTRIRVLTRLAFGFHDIAAMIAFAMLKLGGLCPPLPGRS